MKDGLLEIRQRDGWASARDASITYKLLSKARMKRSLASDDTIKTFDSGDATNAIAEHLRLRPNSITRTTPVISVIRTDLPPPFTETAEAPLFSKRVAFRMATIEQPPGELGGSGVVSLEAAFAALKYSSKAALQVRNSFFLWV